jgi:hypothetical protein
MHFCVVTELADDLDPSMLAAAHISSIRSSIETRTRRGPFEWQTLSNGSGSGKTEHRKANTTRRSPADPHQRTH